VDEWLCEEKVTGSVQDQEERSPRRRGFPRIACTCMDRWFVGGGKSTRPGNLSRIGSVVSENRADAAF
jgi:hypothetical protein